MTTANNLWNITFGDYNFTLNRQTLRYSLMETKTGTVWAIDLPTGGMSLENRATGELVKVDFAEMKRVSISEKASASGKRILFGLDWNGFPVDIYFTCTEREIQLTVEASRDTREWRLRDTFLYPELISVANEENTYITLPQGEGMILFAKDAPIESRRFGIWEEDGLTMPFVGATKPMSTLGLLTDSVYGAFDLTRSEEGVVSLSPVYARDPERRRLDIRLVLLPDGNYMDLARAYRDKVIGERNHVTLRRKIREQPEVESLLSTRNPGSATVPTPSFADTINRWEAIDDAMTAFQAAKEKSRVVGTKLIGDWTAIASDFWFLPETNTLPGAVSVPLLSVVYHDSVVMFRQGDIQRALLTLTMPQSSETETAEESAWVAEKIMPLIPQTFPAFMTEHRFLSPDFQEQEAVYSDKTRVTATLPPH